MSLNVSDGLVPSGSPLPFSEVPIQSVIIVSVVAVVGIAVLVLFYSKYYSNIGSKVYLEVYKLSDGRLQLFRKYHNIGFSRFREEFGSVDDLVDYLEGSLEGQFEASED